jgi:hypothetical protein
VNFILTGFTQIEGFRVFGFEGRRSGKTLAIHTVRADLDLTRRHGIAVQDLPLLCRAMLDRTPEDEERRAWIFTEEEMSRHERTCEAARAAAAARKRGFAHKRAAIVTSNF